MPDMRAFDGAGEPVATPEQEARQRSARAYRQHILHSDAYFAALQADFAAYGALQDFADSLTEAQHTALTETWDDVRAIGARQDPAVSIPASLPTQTP